MVKSKAIEIIKDIHSEDIDPEDKLTAIQEVLDQGACRRVSKDDLVETLRWMVEDYVW